MWRYICILAVIITISPYSSCRKLGGAAGGHHHDGHHHEEHHHGEHHHIDHDTQIQALESSIESVYAPFDGSEEDTSVDVTDDYNYVDYSDSSSDSFDYVYNVIDDNSVDGLDKAR